MHTEYPNSKAFLGGRLLIKLNVFDQNVSLFTSFCLAWSLLYITFFYMAS